MTGRTLCLLATLALGASADDRFPLVTDRVQSWVDHGLYDGCSVWIAQGDKVLYEKSFGTHTPDTQVYIASAGKWLASATMLAVVDDGKLSLDDPAAKWLPEFGTDPKGKATLRQLFSHTSGYPPYQPEGNRTDNYQTCAESVSHLLPLPPGFAPGERFEYGGLAMQAAGRMVEMAEGRDWETIFQERIAKPLGMSRSHFTPVDDKQGGHAPMLGGGAVSTANDYRKFLTMIANEGVFEGRRILSAQAIAEMEADQVGKAVVKREEFVERTRGNTHRGIYGLGMWREEVGADGKATLISSPSWAGMYPWIDKRHDIRGLVITHVRPEAEKAFSGFWTSPVLANLVRAELERETPRGLSGFAAGTARVNGADLSWEAAGSGEPVVLLHGHSFDRRMWDPQFADLAMKHRVIRYDLRGYGLSGVPVEGRSFRHADDLAGLLDALKISKAHVVGLSLGGYVVGDFIALHPDRALSATIASGGVFNGDAARDLSESERAGRLKAIEQTREEGIESHKARWREALLRASTRAGILRPLLTTMIADWSAWQPLHIEPHCLLGPAAIRMLEKSKPCIPVLWIAGRNDTYQNSTDVFSAVLPEMRIVTLPDAGHLSNLEQPAAFTEALEGFLANCGTGRQAGD